MTERSRQGQAIFIAVVLVLVAILTCIAYRALRPDWVRFREAERLAARGDRGAALGLFEECFVHGFRQPRFLVGYVTLLQKEGRAAEALGVLRALDPGRTLDDDIVRIFAGLHAMTGEFEKAVGYYERILERDPTDRSSRFHLAGSLAALERFDEAAEQYRKILGGGR